MIPIIIISSSSSGSSSIIIYRLHLCEHDLVLIKSKPSLPWPFWIKSRAEAHTGFGKASNRYTLVGLCVRLVQLQIFHIPASALAARLGKCAEHSLPV